MNQEAAVGQAIYSKGVLSIYDFWVLGFSNRYLWKCSTKTINKLFSDLASTNHLDVGVGTGYYLKRNLTASTQRLALVDLNINSLSVTSKAMTHLEPEVYCRNILEPLNLGCPSFDSVSMNYLLHCLPGSMNEKGIVFSHVREYLNTGGVVFGSTILGKNIQANHCAKKLVGLYNKKGIFCNKQDDYDSLSAELNRYFTDVQIRVIGCVALFSAKNWK